MKGELAEGVLPGLLRKLFVERLTGFLHLTRGGVRRTFTFREGQLVHLDGLEHVAGTPALARAHARSVLDEVLGWLDGTFHLQDVGSAPGADEGGPKLPTGDLILESIRRVSHKTVELGLGDTSRLLQLSTDPMLRYQRLTLTPEDGYVVSRVDGTFSADELLEITTQDVAQVRRSLYALLCTGVVEYVQGSGRVRMVEPPPARLEPRPPINTAPPPTPKPPPPAPAPPPPPPAAAAAPAPAPPVKPAQSPQVTFMPPTITVKTSWGGVTKPKAAAEPPPPDPGIERRAEIEKAFDRLREKNHFEVLGLSRKATAAEVKEAYFRLARRFHPDVTAHDPALRDLRDEMEAVFIRLGEAYETLKGPISRASYEERLGRMDPLPDPTPAPAPAPVPEPPPAPSPAAPSLDDLARMTALVKKGEKLLAEERWMDAIEFLEKLDSLQGRMQSRAQVALARAYARTPKGTRRAEKILQAAAEADPRYVEVHLALGQLYLASRLKARALAAYRKVLELAPEHEEALAAAAELAAEGAPHEAPEPEGGGLLRKLFKK
jgi:hypothetical protein